MEIIILALVLMIITALGFMLFDKRSKAKKQPQQSEGYEGNLNASHYQQPNEFQPQQHFQQPHQQQPQQPFHQQLQQQPQQSFHQQPQQQSHQPHDFQQSHPTNPAYQPTKPAAAINYSEYKLSLNEYILAVLFGAALFFLVGFIFYHNLIVAAVFSLIGFYFPKIRRVQLRDKRKRDLTLQFKNMLFSLSSSLSAGSSVERALRAVSKDLQLLYPDPNTYILRELELINRRIANGDTIEAAISDFSNRADIEDIQSFADVFTASTRTGGDLVEIIRRTSTIISEKLEIQQEIYVLISGKQLESKILMAAPFALIGFMTYAADGYMDPLFEFPGPGPVIMTVCIVVLCFVYWVLQKIMNIKV